MKLTKLEVLMLVISAAVIILCILLLDSQRTCEQSNAPAKHCVD